MKASITIGTRGSALALWQAEWVKSALMAHHPGLAAELAVIKTKGDIILDVPLAKVGGKGLFVKEIEESLLEGRVDVAVHSMKDMPAQIPDGLCIAAVPEREDPRDVLISKNGLTLAELPQGARIGTSSLRRASQLRKLRPDAEIISLRGNLATRLAKLASQQLDAIVLAAAGVRRLAMTENITQYLDVDTLLPAVGQGALCLETRQNDTDTLAITDCLNHPATRAAITAERAFLKRLEGGCQVPMAAFGTLNGSELSLDGLVGAIDGSNIIRQTLSGHASEADRIGVMLAESLLRLGADTILETLLREPTNHVPQSLSGGRGPR